MKKLTLSIVVLFIIFSLVSCGNEEKGSKADSKQVSNSVSSDTTPTGGGKQQLVTVSGTYEAKQEVIDAAWDSGLVQIDDTLVQLPLRLDEWVALGFDYEVGMGRDTSKDYLFTQNERVSLTLKYKGETLGYVSFLKQTETPETAKDVNPPIESISVSGKPENVTVYFPGGLTFDDNYTAIEQKLGKATEVDGNMNYMYGLYAVSNALDVHYGMKVSVNRNEQVVSGFEIGKDISESARESLTTISFEGVQNVQTTDSHNVNLLWATEYKQVPEVANQRRVDSILNDNGKKYYVSFSFMMLATKYVSEYDYTRNGEPILDETDENGMNRKVYLTNYGYVIMCTKDLHVLSATVKVQGLSDSSEDAYAALQDVVLEVARSIQF